MRLPRPYVPMAVKIAVAERQFEQQFAGTPIAKQRPEVRKSLSDRRYLASLLYVTLGLVEGPYHLDHDPPLMLRDRTRSGGFLPDANDPDWLIWRTKEDHRLKTYVRGPGARRSDVSERRAQKKRERNKIKRATKERRSRWPKRKFPTRD